MNVNPVLLACRRADSQLLLQKCVDKGKEINLTAAVSKDTLTRGLRYAVATGNWGQQGTADLRAGVSQVPHSCLIRHTQPCTCRVPLRHRRCVIQASKLSSHIPCCRCSTGWRMPARCRTCGASTRPSAARASWRSRGSCTTRSGASSAPRRRPRGRPAAWCARWPLLTHCLSHWWPLVLGLDELLAAPARPPENPLHAQHCQESSWTAQVKNLALMAYISVGCSKKPVIEFLDEFGVERLESINPRIVPNATKVSHTAAVGPHPMRSFSTQRHPSAIHQAEQHLQACVAIPAGVHERRVDRRAPRPDDAGAGAA